MEIDALPDDTLLQVLGYLCPTKLLQVRLVCRRWRDIAMHPTLWRIISISTFYHSDAAAVLRLSSCLNTLSVVSGSGKAFHALRPLLDKTTCAVAELRLIFSEANAGFLASVLGRQAVLGRLKRVSLTVTATTSMMPNFRLQDLLQQLLYTNGLESIRLHFLMDPDKWTRPLAWMFQPASQQGEVKMPATLRELVYSTEFVDSTLHMYLEWHAPTLEVVKLLAAPPYVAPLLSCAPNLRKLECVLLQDMDVLEHCAALRKLHLHVNLEEGTLARLPSVDAFLRAAVSRLEHLVLQFLDDERRSEAADLVLALDGNASSCPSTLRTLCFTSDRLSGFLRRDSRQPPLQLIPLTAVIHRLPHLVQLNIGGAPDAAFLKAFLDASVLPSLEVLDTCSPLNCPHEWAHSADVVGLLQRRPRLHVLLRADARHHCFLCVFCMENTCHDMVGCARATLFSHPAEAGCGWRHVGCQVTVGVGQDA